MADERIRVVIEGTSEDLQRALKSAARELNSFEREVDRTNVTTRRSSRDTDDLVRAHAKLKGGVSGLNQQFALLRNVVMGLKWPAMAAGVGVATQAITQLGAGVVGLTSTLNALGPAAAAGAQGITAMVQALGTGVAASHGIGEALKAHATDAKAAGAASISSGKAIAASAQQVEAAQRSLTDARRQARAELDALRFASENAALAERSAELGLRSALAARREANREFVKGRGSLLDLDQADLGVDEARLRVREARKAKQDQAREEADLRRRGIEGSQQVVEALRAVREAQQGVTEAAGGGAAAISKFDEAMKGLPQSSQDFVKQLLAMKPLLEDIRKTAADGVLPGAGRGLSEAAKSFDELNAVVDATAESLGRFLENAGQFIGGEGRDLQLVGESNARVLDELGSATLHLAAALGDMLVAARPLTEHLARMVDHWARGVEETTAMKRSTGELADSFADAQERLDQWGRVLGNLAGAFADVFRAARPLGDTLLTDLEHVTAEWEEWTSSVEGETAMREFFADTLPGIRETAGLFGDLAAAFVRIGSSDSLAPIAKSIREDLLPVLEDLLTTASGEFGVELVKALAEIADLLSVLMGASGALTLFVKALGAAAGFMADLAKSSDLTYNAVTGLLVFLSFQKMLSVAVGLSAKLAASMGATAAAAKLAGVAGAGGAAAGAGAGRGGVLAGHPGVTIAALAAAIGVAMGQANKKDREKETERRVGSQGELRFRRGRSSATDTKPRSRWDASGDGYSLSWSRDGAFFRRP